VELITFTILGSCIVKFTTDNIKEVNGRRRSKTFFEEVVFSKDIEG
jgi:hypothetical protein